MSRVPSSSSLTRAGRRPASRTAVSPMPQPSSTRPGASSSIVAIDHGGDTGMAVDGIGEQRPQHDARVA